MKKLEEMNLMDDFLVGSLLSHKKYGERAVRYILECILNRPLGKFVVVPQRFISADSPDVHGIRMDMYIDDDEGEIFDIEPDQNDGRMEIKVIPRRTRFYHAKIDSANLASGEDYSCLRNVVVIFITTYDPFGLDRVVYTVKNGCVEEPDMPYEDGARTLYLYTRGTKGSPTDELKSLLCYMEKSTEENATSDSLRELHRIVTDIKKDGEVGLAYMKSVEIEKRIREEGRAEGRAEGRKEGKVEGVAEGRSLIVKAFKCAKENAYTTVSQLTEEGYDEETAAIAIDMLNI